MSAAMSAMGERVTYGSFLTFTNNVLLLGKNTFHVLIIRSWSERLDHLVKSDRHLEAIELGIDYYQDPAKALVGLKGPRESKKKLVVIKMTEILVRYLSNCVMTKQFPQEGNSIVLRDYFEKVVPPCVSLCMLLRRYNRSRNRDKADILFDQAWETFSADPFGKAKFLECLESYILSDQLRDLPVGVCQEFVSLYQQSPDRHQALEACLTHLEVTSMDIHQVWPLTHFLLAF